MREITLEELLEAGCHFGHQVTRHNPKARDYIFEARDNIHIIDLAKTKQGLEEAATYVKELAARGGSLLFVATKRQAQPIVSEQLKRVEEADGGLVHDNGSLYYITNHWIGGVLTNLLEVSKNFRKLKDLGEKLRNDEEKAKYTKKEIGGWEKERQKLISLYGGVKDMRQVPDALFIVDTHMEELAVQEGRRTGVPIVGITDTNADPYIIDYPIPANDDAVGSLQLIIAYIMDAWVEGRKEAGKRQEQEAARKAKEALKESEDKKTPPTEPQKEEAHSASSGQVPEAKVKKARKKKVEA